MATRSKNLNAIDLLKADHRLVEGLFDKFEKSKSDNVKARLAKQICTELMVHATIEEELFYPSVKDAVDEEIYTEALVEHDGAKMLIAEIMAGSPAEEFFGAKVKVLSEAIKHHVKEEEQRDGMFAQAKSSNVDMVILGNAMQARKDELAREFAARGLPKPETRAMKGIELRRGEPVEA